MVGFLVVYVSGQSFVRLCDWWTRFVVVALGWNMVPHGADWWRLLPLADVGGFLLLYVGLVLTVEPVKCWLFLVSGIFWFGWAEFLSSRCK